MILAKLHREAAGVISLKATGDRHSNDLHMTFRSSKKPQWYCFYINTSLSPHCCTAHLCSSPQLNCFSQVAKIAKKIIIIICFFHHGGSDQIIMKTNHLASRWYFSCTADFVSLSQSSSVISIKAIRLQPKETRNTDRRGYPNYLAPHMECFYKSFRFT